MKSLFFLSAFLLLPALTAPSAAAAAPQAAATEEVPQWLAELSNLKPELRNEYIRTFSAAKLELARGNWVGCDTELTSCELLFNRNPHVWNMRTVCLIEMQQFDAAQRELNKAKEALPEDPSTLANIATLHMAKGEYRECITEMQELLSDPHLSLKPEVADILRFRVFLSYLMMGDFNTAAELVQDISPLSDTPLYYYSRAAICLYNNDTKGAQTDLQSAARIFNSAAALSPYQRALISCKLAERKTSPVEESTTLAPRAESTKP